MLWAVTAIVILYKVTSIRVIPMPRQFQTGQCFSIHTSNSRLRSGLSVWSVKHVWTCGNSRKPSQGQSTGSHSGKTYNSNDARSGLPWFRTSCSGLRQSVYAVPSLLSTPGCSCRKNILVLKNSSLPSFLSAVRNVFLVKTSVKRVSL